MYMAESIVLQSDDTNPFTSQGKTFSLLTIGMLIYRFMFCV